MIRFPLLSFGLNHRNALAARNIVFRQPVRRLDKPHFVQLAAAVRRIIVSRVQSRVAIIAGLALAASHEIHRDFLL
jgi:hypothetical protein